MWRGGGDCGIDWDGQDGAWVSVVGKKLRSQGWTWWYGGRGDSWDGFAYIVAKGCGQNIASDIE